MSICPEGHESQSADYCDTCGAPIDESTGSSPSAPSTGSPSAQPAGPVAIECPNCRVENVPDALFCEACGYDFTTGTMPRPWVNPFALPGDHGSSSGHEAPEPAEPVVSPSEPETPETAASPTETETAAPQSPVDVEMPEPLAPSIAVETPPADSVDPIPTTPASPAPALDPDPALDEVSAEFSWVAELWVDPDWYRKQEPPDPMPSPGLPDVVPLRRRSILIGRESRSRNIIPDIDCGSDPGASRRQAQLTTDGRRWWVEDLDSSNGTYVSGAAEALPDQPVPVGQRHELEPDDRVYLGAWTRLVIRKATDEEQEAFGG